MDSITHYDFQEQAEKSCYMCEEREEREKVQRVPRKVQKRKVVLIL